MTDNEIIKALDDRMYCGKWIGKGFLDKKDFQILKNALDLINRQQAEIERLKAEEEKYPFKCVMPFNSMICSKSIDDYDRLINDIEVDAIKEFVDRLNEKLCDCHIVSDGEYCGFDCSDVHDDIDNLVKEYER